MKSHLITRLYFLAMLWWSCEKQDTLSSPTRFNLLDLRSDSKCDGKPPHLVEVIDGFRKCIFFEFDKIPPIDTPIFVSTDSINDVPDDWEVIVIFDGEIAKAYLLSELNKREVVNDFYGDTPVVVIY